MSSKNKYNYKPKGDYCQIDLIVFQICQKFWGTGYFWNLDISFLQSLTSFGYAAVCIRIGHIL